MHDHEPQEKRMASEFEGRPVYEVDEAPRVVFANGSAVIEFTGGDGPFYVQLPERSVLQMIYQGLLAGGKQTVGAQLDGIDLGRDDLTQNLVMMLKFEGGGSMNVVLNSSQEDTIKRMPSLPPREPRSAH